MKNINVLGVQLNDLSVREAIKLVAVYLNSESLNTVGFVSTNLLLEARDSDSLRESIEGMDIVVPTKPDIIKASGYREREISNNVFMHEFLKKLSREKRKIFIVGSTEEEQVAIREALLRINDKLVFFGCFSFTDQDGSEDALINEINSVLPDVVISQIDSPRQEEFIHAAKQKVNARIWLSLQKENLLVAPTGQIKRGKIKDFFDRILFKRVVNKYDSEKNEGNEKV